MKVTKEQVDAAEDRWAAADAAAAKAADAEEEAWDKYIKLKREYVNAN